MRILGGFGGAERTCKNARAVHRKATQTPLGVSGRIGAGLVAAGRVKNSGETRPVVSTRYPRRGGAMSVGRKSLKYGRSERIRTSGPCLPKTVLYQAELHSADRARYIGKMPRRRNRIALRIRPRRP